MQSTRAVGREVEERPRAADLHFARVAAGGSAGQAHLCALLRSSGPHAARDLADAIHLLCSIHGRHPALIDMALVACPSGAAHDWLTGASDEFERERLYLVRLASAVGALPSTPGAAQSEAAIQAQRHAIETLATSERPGCALGAATALVGDWAAIRPLLDRAAARAGIECPPSSLPTENSLARVIDLAVDGGISCERAFSFGSEQLLLQHRALFGLLEARAAARPEH